MSKFAFSLWAFFDLLTLLIYFSLQWYYGKVPFYSDYIANREMVGNVLGNTVLNDVLLIGTVLLFLSLPLSIYAFKKAHAKLKWLVLAQIPLRFVAGVSSVPLLFGLIIKLTPISLQVHFYFAIVLGILFFVIEGYKFFSVLKKS